jgi:preprotein translocase subunit Sec61beta
MSSDLERTAHMDAAAATSEAGSDTRSESAVQAQRTDQPMPDSPDLPQWVDVRLRGVSAWFGTGGVVLIAGVLGWCYQYGVVTEHAAYFGIPRELVAVDPKEAVVPAAIAIGTLVILAMSVVVWFWRPNDLRAHLGVAVVITVAGSLLMFVFAMPPAKSGTSGLTLAGALILFLALDSLVCALAPIRQMMRRPLVRFNEDRRRLLRTAGLGLIVALVAISPRLAVKAGAVMGASQAASTNSFHILLAQAPTPTQASRAHAGPYVVFLIGDKAVVRQIVTETDPRTQQVIRRLDTHVRIISVGSAPLDMQHVRLGRIQRFGSNQVL